MHPTTALCCALAFGLCLCPLPARGRTLGETVESHLEENLKKPDDSEKGSEQASDESTDAARERSEVDGREAKSPEPSETAEQRRQREEREEKERRERARREELERQERRERIEEMEAERKERNRGLPKRVLPSKWISLDPQVAVGYRGWLPDSYPALDVEVQNFLQWSVGVKGRFFRMFRIYRAGYQSAGLSSPRNRGADIAEKAAKAGPNVAAKALGFIGIEVNFPVVPMVSYSTRAYEMTATPKQPVRIIPFTASQSQNVRNFPLTEQTLSGISTFETFIAGIRYNDKRKRTPEQIERNPHPLPYYFGVALTRYAKPYQVRVGDATLDELVFDGRFRGAGLSGGFELPSGLEKLGLEVEADVGLGEIRLTEDLKLNDVLPSDWLMGYARGSVTLSWTQPVLRTKPTLLFRPTATATGASFFYFNLDPSEDDVDEAPLANWDIIWSAMGTVVLPL